MSDEQTNEASPLKLAVQEVVDAFGCRAGFLMMVGPDGTIYCVGAAKDADAAKALDMTHKVLQPAIAAIQMFLQGMEPCSACQARGNIAAPGSPPVVCIRCGGKRFVPKPTTAETIAQT